MKKHPLVIEEIPALLWGENSEQLYLFVHGKMSCKEEAAGFAQIAVARGYQVLSFDLPEHGERKGKTDVTFDIWNGIRDLHIIMNYVEKHWKNVSLFACSIGAYFSLMTYAEKSFSKCLFLSPIVDMKQLIEDMMKWYSVSEEELQAKGIIDTPMGEKLDWMYYRYVVEHPVVSWLSPTMILYGSADNLMSQETIQAFVEKHGAELTVLEGGEHWFHTEEQVAFLEKWLDERV